MTMSHTARIPLRNWLASALAHLSASSVAALPPTPCMLRTSRNTSSVLRRAVAHQTQEDSSAIMMARCSGRTQIAGNCRDLSLASVAGLWHANFGHLAHSSYCVVTELGHDSHHHNSAHETNENTQYQAYLGKRLLHCCSALLC